MVQSPCLAELLVLSRHLWCPSTLAAYSDCQRLCVTVEDICQALLHPYSYCLPSHLCGAPTLSKCLCACYAFVAGFLRFLPLLLAHGLYDSSGHLLACTHTADRLVQVGHVEHYQVVIGQGHQLLIGNPEVQLPQFKG